MVKRFIATLAAVAFASIALSAQTYVHNEFENGRVYYKDGGFSAGSFNICIIDQSLRYIEDGKEMILGSPENVDRVNIGKDIYFRRNGGYICWIDSADDVSLGLMKTALVKTDVKNAAYGATSETTRVSNISSIYDGGNSYDLKSSLNLPCVYKSQVYLCRNNKFYPATSKRMTKMFPAKKAEIKAYLADKNVNFDDIDQVKALFEVVK